MISAAVLAVLTLIEQILPLLTGGGQTVALITNIIEALIKFMPLIENEVSTVYQSVKNIISALSANPATTGAQLDALAALDKQVDAAWQDLEPEFDPDAPTPTVGG